MDFKTVPVFRQFKICYNYYMLPKEVRTVLWSYDLKKIDPEKHQKTIVAQVLNWGSKKATDWLFRHYGKKQVAQIARQIPRGAWHKKSLALWSLVLGIKPQERRKKFR